MNYTAEIHFDADIRKRRIQQFSRSNACKYRCISWKRFEVYTVSCWPHLFPAFSTSCLTITMSPSAMPSSFMCHCRGIAQSVSVDPLLAKDQAGEDNLRLKMLRKNAVNWDRWNIICIVRSWGDGIRRCRHWCKHLKRFYQEFLHFFNNSLSSSVWFFQRGYTYK